MQTTLSTLWKIEDPRPVVVTLPPAASPFTRFDPDETVCVDLFCGIGGWSTGASAAGHKVVLAVDFNRELLKIHAKNHPHTRHVAMSLGPASQNVLLERIRQVVPKGQKWHLHASPPCTKLSNMKGIKRKHAGTTRGTDLDDGLDLVLWFVDFCLKAKPTTWTFEQVPLPEIDGILKLARYQHANRVDHVKAVDFRLLGVPQTRTRTIAGSPCIIRKLRRMLSKDVSASALSMRCVLAPPTEAVFCLANTGRVADSSKTEYHDDGSTSNPTVFKGCYRKVDDVAPTCCAGNPHRWCARDYATIRRFTPQEQALLQTFPPKYKLGPSQALAYTGVGNAFPCIAARRLMQNVEVTKSER